MPTQQHIHFGDAIVGSRLIGYATKIMPVKARNPFGSQIQIKLKKTRGRNSECYLDVLLKSNKVNMKDIIDKIIEFCKITNKITMPNNFSIYSSLEDFLVGDTLIAFCDRYDSISKASKEHGHNWQCIKGISGSLALCYVDTPCYIEKNEKLSLK